jgi:Sec-independent protein translocase protein TatA
MPVIVWIIFGLGKLPELGNSIRRASRRKEKESEEVAEGEHSADIYNCARSVNYSKVIKTLPLH